MTAFSRWRQTAAAAAGLLFAMAMPAAALDGVVASIKPVHSLVAAVMDGVGTPALIVRGGGSEHVHSLRPSDATTLQEAKVVFRIGERMETFLNAPLRTLAGAARVVSLEDAPGLSRLPLRGGGPFEAHDHDHDHDHAHHDDDGHDHDAHAGGHDLHIWLDPLNARAMVMEIARVLGEADPQNAGRYRDNADSYAARLDGLVAEIRAVVEPVGRHPAIVFHDAYQYFEKRFGVNVAGSITVSPEVLPGAQRLSEIRARIGELGAVCVFSEPQFEPRLVRVVTEGTEARTGVLDPLGAGIDDGPDLYPTLLRNLAQSLASCLSPVR